jgi:hypothetical protein
MDILNRVLLLLFILSALNILRHGFFLIRSFRSEERFVLDKKSLLYLGVSISYFLMSIINGIIL